MSLSNMIAIAKKIEFGALYIKPAFVFIDESGHLVIQFEADATSAIGYLYDSFCKQVGISWNYETICGTNVFGLRVMVLMINIITTTAIRVVQNNDFQR